MCGIAGVLLPEPGPVDEAELQAMASTLTHRGPDGAGIYRAEGVGLGHRRLNVVDIEGGRQPMSNEDGTVWVTYNGEIYNHGALRRELEARGHRFASRCDTEVLVHGYEEWGDSLPEHLAGMFAFAVWDGRRRRALLARDRMGQKPLFYAHLPDGRLLFGSEAKAVVAHPDRRPAIDEAALAAYLTYEYLPGDLCLFEGVTKLPPAHIAIYEAGELAIRRYWDIPFQRRFQGSFGEATDAFREAFEASVEARLMADVPLGVFLSGGLDSSAVAAALVARRPPASIDTFSIGFEEQSFDESPMARRVAEHLGTNHHERTFSATAMLDTLPRVMDLLDEPFGDASLLPTYLLSEFTRESVTVALGGDGSDELLMGYPTFKADEPARLWRHLPAPLRRLVTRQLQGLPVRTHNFSFDFVVKSFLKAADRPDDMRHPLWLGSFVPGSADDPLLPERRQRQPLDKVLAPAVEAYSRAGTTDPRQRLSYQYCRTYLAEDILVKVDRASMAVSLEARSPFLDHRLVELAASFPARYKLRGLTSKRVLRAAFKADLPKIVLTRKKKGFGMPVAEWLKGPLRERTTDLLDSGRLKRSGWLRHEVVGRLLEEHLRGRRDNRKPLWTLLMFEIWRERYSV